MNTDEEIRAIHKRIQNNILRMIPEKYRKICLYASANNKDKEIKGEMFFYYFPSGILKKNPINVYEIPEMFNIDDNQYSILEKRLYETIMQLKNYYILKDGTEWSNITITIYGTKYKVEFNYDNLSESEFSSFDRHIIWRFKNLELPMERFSKTERLIIERYFKSTEDASSVTNIYEENVYEKPKITIMDYDDTFNNENEDRQKSKDERQKKKEEKQKSKDERQRIKEKQKKRKNERQRDEVKKNKKKKKDDSDENNKTVKNQLLNF